MTASKHSAVISGPEKLPASVIYTIILECEIRDVEVNTSKCHIVIYLVWQTQENIQLVVDILVA